MLLNLIVHEFKYLQTICKGCLCRFCFRKEIYDLTAGERLLDVLILEENYLVTVRPNLSLDSIWEDNFFLAALVELLLLSFGAYHFVDLNEALVGLIRVILLRKHQVKIFFFLFLAVLLIYPMGLVDMFI